MKGKKYNAQSKHQINLLINPNSISSKGSPLSIPSPPKWKKFTSSLASKSPGPHVPDWPANTGPPIFGLPVAQATVQARIIPSFRASPKIFEVEQFTQLPISNLHRTIFH